MIFEIISLYSTLIFIWLLWLSSMKIVERYYLMNKYKTILDMMEYFYDKAYSLIYTDQIIAYTSSGYTKIQKEEFETIERNFVKLTLDLMGSENQKLAEKFYGGLDSLLENMLLYIRQRIEQDKIAKLFNEGIQDTKS